MAWKMNLMIKRCFCLRPEAEDVRVLDFKHRSLTDVPNEVFNFERTLEELHLNSNQIHDLPRPLFHCHGLRILGLSDNEIHSLPHAIASLINLVELDISKNAILDIPDNIKGCKCLRVLDASVNPLGKLSEGFTQLINLQELYLNDTFIEFLPANFGRLVRLRILELRENHLKSLSKSMGRLAELSLLDIGQNDFKELPEVIGDFIKLSELWCDCNRISSLPAFFGKLRNLTYLDASQNRISSIPMEIESCINLTDLTLTGNDLSTLPDSIGKLINLSVLRLDGNELQRLPNSLGSLTNLEELILSQNDLKALPASLGVLRKMHTLIVDDNLLEELPSELGSCSGLTILSFRGNRLGFVPDELGHLSSLRILNLSDNRLRYLPFSVTKLRSLQALWLSENQNKPIIPLQRDIDIDTGQRVLTCFIFPQVRQSDCDVHTSDSDSLNLAVWEEQRPRRQHITFAVDDEFDRPENALRSTTAYPKELKAHVKHARNCAIKSKVANYVNIDDVHVEPNEIVDDDVDGRKPEEEVVCVEVPVWPASPSVVVKEARVTKSQIHSPKPHDRRSLRYKFDKEELAKDKARISHRTLSSSDLNNWSSTEKTDSEKSVTANSPKQLFATSGLFDEDNERASVTKIVNDQPRLAEPSDERVKKITTAATTILKFPCLKSAENGFTSGDRDVYSNLTGSPSKVKSIRVYRTDGYASDFEVSRSRCCNYDNDDYSDATVLVQPASPIRKRVTSKPATISTAVARKLGCGRGAESDFTGNSFTDVVPPSGYLRMLPPRSSIGTWSRSDSQQLPKSSISQRSVSRSSPVPNLPPRSGPWKQPTTLHTPPRSPGAQSGLHRFSPGPPALPPKRRSSNASIMQPHYPLPFAKEPTYVASGYPSAMPPSTSPPCQQHRKPPPPYHIAATYSRQALPGASIAIAAAAASPHRQHAHNPTATYDNPARHADYQGSPLSPRTGSSSRGTNGRSPPNVRHLRIPAFPVLPTPMRIPARGSDSSSGATPPSPMIPADNYNQSSLFATKEEQMQHYNEEPLYNARFATPTSWRSRDQSINGYAENTSSVRMATMPSSRTRRPDTLSLSADSEVTFKFRSASAPSTPPSGDVDKSFSKLLLLPPYRTPPLYGQSASTESLQVVGKDSGLLKMCLHSPSSLRRLGLQMRGNASSASLHGSAGHTYSKESSLLMGASPGVFKRKSSDCRPLNISTSEQQQTGGNYGGVGQSLLKIADSVSYVVDNKSTIAINDENANSLASRCRNSPAALSNGIFTARPVVIDDVVRVRRASESGESSTSSVQCRPSTPSSTTSTQLTPPAVNYSSHPAAQLQMKPWHNPWLFGQHRNPKVIPVVIQKNPNLGFTVSWNPRGTPNGKGTCIATVTPKGSASSVLQPGDKLLQVDGVDITSLDLSQVHTLLEDTGSTVFLMISRENGC